MYPENKFPSEISLEENNNEKNSDTVQAQSNPHLTEPSPEPSGMDGCAVSELTQAAEKLTFRDKLRIRGFFSLYFTVTVFIFLFSLLVYITARMSPAFAELWSRYPSFWLKMAFAKLTTLFGFSLAECLLLSVPVLVIAYLAASWRAMGKAAKPADFYKWLLPLICVVLLVVSSFFMSFGPNYFRAPLEENLGLEKKGVSAEELYYTAIKLAEEMDAVLDEVNFRYGGASVMPYSYKELTVKMNEAFRSYADSVDYIGSFYAYPKPIALSGPFTYTHISGVYSFITGEANININYPDFIIPFTVAHEMSHQRGIAREDEANFVAFLVCIQSEDAYIRYSGYSNMINYVMSALYKADKTLYADFYHGYYPASVRSEFSAYSLFFDKYRNSTASTVTGTINNSFLSSQGQTAGIKSYGLVVDLTVAHYKAFSDSN